MPFKILIEQHYQSWIWLNPETMLIADPLPTINPLEYKLLTLDVIDDEYKIIDSPMRSLHLPGILILIGKTYGRSKNGTGKFYYKCIPHDKRLPSFLITYEQKEIGFSKKVSNQYVLFKYSGWSDKHPIGTLINRFGPVSDTSLSGFYEYQLYCKNLAVSIKDFTKFVNQTMKKHVESSYINSILAKNPSIENRSNDYVITIDPYSSTDLDDAIGIKNNTLSVYIANVPLLMEELELWSVFSDRIATIYLPDRKCPMLPTILSENLCSLLENEERLTFCIDITFNNDTITNIKFCNTLIKVRRNYRYNTPELEDDPYYKNILQSCRILSKKYNYIKEIKDSHDLVAYLMILMNIESANKMTEFKNGIYRTVSLTTVTPNIKISNDIIDFIKIWQSSSGQYTSYENKSSHDLISGGVENYIHITSPIRRLVDLLNMIQLQSNLKLADYKIAQKFYSEWTNKLEYINTTMHAIRKIQIDCNMLHICINNSNVLNKIYDGYIFDKIERTNKYLQYTVYIPDIKLITRVNIKEDLKDYSCHKFKLYLIEDGTTLKRKIRAEMI